MSVQQLIATNAAAGIVAALDTLGLPVPPRTGVAIAVYEAGVAAVSGADAPFDLDAAVEEATPESVGDLIRGIGQASLEHDVLQRGAGPDVVNRLARRLLRAVRADGPGLIDAVGPHFTKAAKAFTKAVAQLPDGVQAEVLVAGGPSAVAAFADAGAAHATMTTALGVRNALAALGVSAGTGDLELATRCAVVDDLEAGELATEAMRSTGALAPFLALVAVPGCELAWLGIEHQAAHIAGLRPPVAA